VETLPGLRIGALSRRLGVSAQLLRIWETRYGLLQPARSPGGYRLYTETDERRVRRMQAYLAQGMSAAEAARAALSEERADTGAADAGHDSVAEAAAALTRCLDAFDESGAQAALDRLLAGFTVESVLRHVIMPCLHDIGERWARGQESIAAEHFAPNVLRGRLAGMARGWSDGRGPGALLACPPGEHHDLALMTFGIVLHRNGWRVNYLGADTPMDEVTRTAQETSPDLVVLSAVDGGRYHGQAAALARLASVVPVALAGPGATEALALATGCRLLAGDPVTEAQAVAGGPSRRGSAAP
jgi:DNA-binding transcriptional MerR regulator